MHLRRLSLLLLLSATALSAQTTSSSGKDNVVRYHATIDTVKYVYGVAPPVANVRTGNILEANSWIASARCCKSPAIRFRW